jgi:hypothetical protein
LIEDLRNLLSPPELNLLRRKIAEYARIVQTDKTSELIDTFETHHRVPVIFTLPVIMFPPVRTFIFIPLAHISKVRPSKDVLDEVILSEIKLLFNVEGDVDDAHIAIALSHTEAETDGSRFLHLLGFQNMSMLNLLNFGTTSCPEDQQPNLNVSFE